MHDNVHYYSYGSYLIHREKKERPLAVAESQGDLGHVSFEQLSQEKALEKAAKKICTLKCGLCPIQEEDFAGCPVACHEEIRPWQCWVAHFKRVV